MAQATVFNEDPAAQARDFAEQGFEWLHLVDLNGAFAGRPVNAAAVDAILAAIDVPVQLGGGIRDMATVETWLAKGIRRVILGTAAVRDPDFVRKPAASIPGASRWPSMPGTARSPPPAGPRPPISPPPTSPSASRMPASPPSSTPTSIATGC
jgi:2,4-dienoyl-CoA reductase-like NADH-dependent reductase (Old Yellow Enzyme family)